MVNQHVLSKSWEVVGQVIDLIYEFFASRAQHNMINETNLVLILKIGCPKFVNHYRLLSLCNFCYKVVSKVMTNRMKGILPKFTSENQIAHEAFHYLKCKKEKKFEMDLKVDMSMAYDHLGWDLIKVVLLKLGFCREWVTLIMKCISSVWYYLLLVGKKIEEVTPQGD